MADALKNLFRGSAAVAVDVEFDEEHNIVVKIENTGVHGVSIQSLVVSRHNNQGGKLADHFGEGYADPLPFKRQIFQKGQGDEVVIEGGDHLVGAQAMVTYIEISGVALSEVAENRE